MGYNRETLIQRKARGETLTFVPFWRHVDEGGAIGRCCLSQWYDCRFEMDGVVYHTTEQYMMARKAMLFGDEETRRQIMAAREPRDFKALGRRVRGFDSGVWDQNKYAIVVRGNMAKFSQNPELWAFLDGTGDSVLVEASPYDAVWGVRLGMDDPRISDPGQWGGENLLGFALMEVRDALRVSWDSVFGG